MAAAAQGAAIDRLQMALEDGRTENVRYRQDQLQSLHKTLCENATAICTAIAQDTKASAMEVETEFFLSMDAVRHFYESLNFAEALKDEYSVTQGKNYSKRRLGVGMVVIRPTSHTRLYSILSPLAAAISAGNCVILELQDTLLQIDSNLRNLLPAALDGSTFCISKTVTDGSILGAAVLVDQTSNTASQSSTTQLLSSPTARTVAFVDRTADIQAAAKAITTARFSFGGTSPYAPDLVLVNEYAKKEFFEACSKYATLAFARDSEIRRVSGNQSEATRKAVKESEEKRQVTSFGSNDFKLVDISDKNTPLMDMKISGRYLPIATCSGLVDAIFTHEFKKPLLAGYFFADPGSAKYMAQHLPCHISCLNQIPVQLLVGPAAPIAHDPELDYRYRKEMFSVGRPQYVEPPAGAFAEAEKLLEGARGVNASSIRKLAVQPLKPTGQGSNWGIGFFEQGILIGASIMLTVVIPLVGYTTWITGRKGFQLAMRWKK
ncbi:Aldehyde/histidinol dehydrogenase [Xylariomycetidae sp. FL2044]|nr:Aldehyde/histidinol dehydrogenase [Xylariomycetidae sp. FL2044]KAH9904808.1 Aldehyde/histidinol dehydrogenase [Xylariomycetidae sp. FL2044]